MEGSTQGPLFFLNKILSNLSMINMPYGAATLGSQELDEFCAFFICKMSVLVHVIAGTRFRFLLNLSRCSWVQQTHGEIGDCCRGI